MTFIKVFREDGLKLFMKKYNDIDKKMEGSGFNFEFIGSLSIKCDKVNVPKVSSYIGSPKWLRYKKAKINKKVSMIDVFSMLLRSTVP